MKKYLLVCGLAIILLVGACVNEEPEAESEGQTNESEQTEGQGVENSDNTSQEEEAASGGQSGGQNMSREEFEEENAPGMADAPTEDRDFSTATEDVMEFVEYNDYDILVDEVHDYLILERYEFPEVHESGRNRIDFNGFKQEFGLFLVEDSFGYRYIFYGGEHINDTDYTVQYYGTMTFVTDLGEQVSPDSGLMGYDYNNLILDYEPGVRRTGFSVTQLENQDEIPEEIKVVFESIYYDGSADGILSDDYEATFHKK